jgi:general secretion pathway protein E
MLRRLGDMLKESGKISSADIEKARMVQSENGGLFGQSLLRIGALSEDSLLETLSRQLGMEILTQASGLPEEQAIRETASQLRLNTRWLAEKQAVAWFTDTDESPSSTRRTLVLTGIHPQDIELLEVIEARLSSHAHQHQVPAELRLSLCSRSLVEQLLQALVDHENEEENLSRDGLSVSRLKEMAEEAPVIEFVSRTCEQSLKENASDIHIEPFERTFDVRYRVDGVLQKRGSFHKDRYRAVVSRIKLLSGMDIAEQRLPQDGRQSIRIAGEFVDMRVSTLPGKWGESLVVRLLRKERGLPNLEGLGLGGRAMDIIQSSHHLQNGIVLVTGPTGSGKSTTLYRLLQEANDGLRKIITVEDPVEYDMQGIVQVQAKSEIGLTFAASLRSILRQDPDVIMIGEIRDAETAAIATQAALTGHLVYSTLHTNSALAAIDRLADLGVERFLIASSVRVLAAQRLVRRLCPDCSAAQARPDADRLLQNALADGLPAGLLPSAGPGWKTPVGCPKCSHTGFSGRIGLFEVCQIDDELQKLVLDGAPVSRYRAAARNSGYISLMEDGLLKAAAGLTSFDEVVRVLGSESIGMESV